MESFKEFDDSDWASSMISDDNPSADSDDEKGCKVVAAKMMERPQVPNHLLMVALLEHICALQVKDKNHRHELFKLICGKLSELNAMSPLTYMDEFSNIREQYRNSFAGMMNAAMVTLQKSKTFGISFVDPKNFARYFNPREITRQPILPAHNVFAMKSTRYETEFVEINILGKGGFGKVFRVRHKLDGCEYAVKKIRFRNSNPDVCLKILREVKVLASLTHDNIVRYNNAWVEEFGQTGTITGSQNLEQCALEYKECKEKKAAVTELDDDSIVFDTAASGLREYVDSPRITELKSRTSMEVHVDSEESLSVNTSIEGSAAAGCSDNGEASSMGSASNLSGFYTKLPINDTSVRDTKPLEHIPLKRKGSTKSTEESKKQHSETIEESRRIRRRSGEKPTGLGDPPFTNKQDLQRSLSVNGNGRVHKSDSTSPRQHAHLKSDEECKKCARTFCRSRRSISFDPMVCDMCDEQYIQMERCWQRQYPFAGKIHLFIQMELCDQTLKDWMDTRNMTAVNLSGDERYSVVNEAENMRILYQVLEGLAYIHRQDLIHRDIKPRNIFVYCRTLQVKIGDFGLARDLWTATLEDSHDDTRSSGHTKKVGTSMYAAPEQLRGSNYDSKCDLYSLGVVLYEIFQPYNTGMERVDSLKNLRKGDICPMFQRNWSPQTCCLKDMMAAKHETRPSAQQLLKHEMFQTMRAGTIEVCSHDNRSKSGESGQISTALEEKDLIIQQQKMLLEVKDNLIDTKDAQLLEKDNLLKDKELLLEEKDSEIAALRLQLLALQTPDK